MQYLSPVTLIGPSFQPPFDAKMIQRERKKLLVDLELNGGEILEVNGRRFTKNEIIDYFEELQREDIAAYHQAISEDPVLLKFLQAGSAAEGSAPSIDEDATFKDTPLYDDPGFIGWVSPYFHSAFTKFAAHCFNSPNAVAMWTLLRNKLLMTPDEKERSWQFIAGILEKNIALFDHYRNRGQKRSPKPMPITRVAPFLAYNYTQVIKQLPDSRFARLKDNYAHNMQHPAIAVFNREPRNRSLAVTWVENALDLSQSPPVIERIQEKLDELRKLQRRRRRRRILRIIYIIIASLGMLMSLLSGNH
jgi:hypothetical protein